VRAFAWQAKGFVSVHLQDEMNPLIFAALNGHMAVVDTLLQYGATVDKIDRVSVVDNIFITLLMNVCMHL